ncbi:alpha/beta hydrolase family protein [Salmonirosea aquatica]|uniref:Alpha/beta fold hydrolase n=1 Tax=Salmonirosea aquatica TaxID=2654236 RepID=A0A7C9BEF8_9BACT|nr:alpha/beta fold hydrolase [Cytophagaceae bacterium SJW1-29]
MRKNVVLISASVAILAYLVYIVLSEKPFAIKFQEPKPPYPYHTEEVQFKNDQAGITLSGTLTIPEKDGNFPAVVLITGSGPQNRNEEVFGHKPFLVIADYLTRQGFAVLRYDDRGVGQSTGNFMTATSQDFAADAESAMAYLKSRKEINLEKMGVAGHSEGGLVAAIAASRSKDISFVISLAGPGVTGIEVMTLQAELIARAGGVDEKGIAMLKKINQETTDILRKSTDTTQHDRIREGSHAELPRANATSRTNQRAVF